MDVLTIKNLHKKFNNKEVLCGVDLTIPEQSIFGFVGVNGAGKTTTMKAILGLLKIDEGEIFVLGEKVKYGETPTNKHIGYLPDVPEFYSFMTPKEYLVLCGESLGLSKEEIDNRSNELLELVGLLDEKKYIKGFSRGMKQRLGIAQALLGRPKLLICDEPTSALDPIGRKEILDLLLSVKSLTTVLFSTHILSDVERICTNVAFLNNGKIVLEGTVEELKEKYASEKIMLELVNSSDSKLFLEKFECNIELNNIIISGGFDVMEDVLNFINLNKIKFKKIEKLEPSLESLFMEVVK